MQQQVVGARQESSVERMTNWLIEVIGQFAQLILLVAVAYAAYKVSPGHTDNALLDQIWIIGQMVALDVSAPGLARLSKQERQVGNEERANQLKTISKVLLTMGILTGAEVATFSFFPHIDGTIKDVVSWALMIGRVATALLYMYALHSGGKEGKNLLVQMQEMKASYEQKLQELTTSNKDLFSRCTVLETQYNDTLKLQQDQARQYIALRDEHHTLRQTHDLLLSDHATLKAQHTDLVTTNQTMTARYADLSQRCEESEKLIVTLTEERDSLKNILSVMSAKQVSQTMKNEVSQPQEKLSQSPTRKVSRTAKNDSKKLSRSTPTKLSRVDTQEEREARLEQALQELQDANERVSARTLSDKTGYNRNITNDWLKSRNVTPQRDSGDDTSETVTDEERDTGEMHIVSIEKYKDVVNS